jgi:hypothetical protein
VSALFALESETILKDVSDPLVRRRRGGFLGKIPTADTRILKGEGRAGKEEKAKRLRQPVEE